MKKEIKVAIIGLSGQSIFLEVDDFHKPGETIIAKNVHVEPGGKGYNQAACLLKLGAKVSYLTTVGEDNYAKICYEYLNQTNASLHFKMLEEHKTALATILTNRQGDNQVTVFHGASKELNLNHLNEFASEIKSADILLLTLELPLEIVEGAISLAKENNVFVILNPAPYNSKFKLFDLCDVIIPNEIEAKQIFKIEGYDIEEVLNDLIQSESFKNNFKNVIITLGSRGCLLIDKNEIKKIEGLKVKSLDTTGAGDVFSASFAYFYGLSKDIVEASNYANIAAAISTTNKHVLNALPSLDEILSYKKI